jgi:hypothetical protein
MSRTEIVDGARDYRLMTRQMVDAILSVKEYNRFSKGIFSWVGFKTKWVEFENVERLRGEPLVPPSIHASDLPSFVNEMLLKGLSLDPAERPQEAAELLAIIDREVAFSVSPVAGTGNASVSARLLHEKRSPFGFLTSRRSFRPTVL